MIDYLMADDQRGSTVNRVFIIPYHSLFGTYVITYRTEMSPRFVFYQIVFISYNYYFVKCRFIYNCGHRSSRTHKS